MVTSEGQARVQLALLCLHRIPAWFWALWCREHDVPSALELPCLTVGTASLHSYLQGNASSLCWDIQKALVIAARLPGHNYISDLRRGTPVIRWATAGQQIHILVGSKIFSHQRIYDFYQAVTVTTAFCVLVLNKRDVALQSALAIP